MRLNQLQEKVATFTKPGIRINLIKLNVGTDSEYYQCQVNKKKIWNATVEEIARKKMAQVVQSYLLQCEMPLEFEKTAKKATNVIDPNEVEQQYWTYQLEL